MGGNRRLPPLYHVSLAYQPVVKAALIANPGPITRRGRLARQDDPNPAGLPDLTYHWLQCLPEAVSATKARAGQALQASRGAQTEHLAHAPATG